jgi:CelD/BcsL family acetyltransferase involved in cellulose biosynthesis
MSGWTIVPLQRSLGAHAFAWDALNERSFGHHPLLTSLFINGLLHNFGDGTEYLCHLGDGGRTQAMCVLKRKNPLMWVSFLPSQGQLAPTLIPDGALLPSLLHSLPGWVVQLDLLCNDPEVGGVTKSTQPPTHRINHALTMKVALAGTFEAYWAARSKQLRSNVKRYEKRLLADGLTQRFVEVRSPDQMLAAVGRYATLEGEGWKGRNGTALGSTPEQYQFYQNLMLGAAADGNSVVHELWFGDQLAASRLILHQNEMQVILKTSYDERFASYAPGRLLLRGVIESAFSEGANGAIEFYTDANADQLTWATDQRWIQHTSVYRWPIAEDVLHVIQAFGRAKRVVHPGEAGGKSVFRVDVFNHPDALPVHVQRFMNLVELRNIGFGVEWYRNLVKTVYPADSGIRFYALHRNEQIVAVLPLRATRDRGTLRLTSLSNFYTSLYEPILAPEIKSADLVLILSALRNDFPRFTSLKLSPMDPASHAYQTLLGAMRIKGWLPFEYFTFGNWYQPVVGDWADYLAGRSGTLRSTIKRMTKKLAADGGRLEIVTDPKDIAVAIAAYTEVYAASWKRPEQFPAFMPGLLHSCAEKGFLRLGLAWLNGQPIAAQMWIVAHGRAEIYKVAYHESFKAYAPGTLVTSMLMKHAIEIDKVTEVDYLIGDDAYKKTWMSHRRERWGIIAYNPRSIGGMAGFAYELLGRSVKAWRNQNNTQLGVGPLKNS